MKMCSILIRGTLVSAGLCFSAVPFAAAPRDTTPGPPSEQILMRVTWDDDSSAGEWVTGLSFSHTISSPRDAASGLPTGKRQHKPFTFTKPVDKLTPQLLGAYVAGTPLAGIEFLVSRTDQDGNELPYFTIKLDRPSIVLSTTGGRSGSEPAVEEVWIVYEKITWTYEPSGDSASDSWTVE